MQSLRTSVLPALIRNISSSRTIHTSSIFNMPIKVGDNLPDSVDLFEGAPDKKVSSKDLHKGKVVIFGVPGAFTPTCSKEHAPGFVNSIDAIKAKGVSQVVCVSVNDPFVMDSWGKTLDPNGKVRFLADTCGDFTKALDLSLDVTAVLGNVRSQRYALVADNGKVTAINVEGDGVGLSCSRATDVLKLI